MTAFLILQGVETLSLRMEKHMDNTRQMIRFLSEPQCKEDPSQDLKVILTMRSPKAPAQRSWCGHELQVKVAVRLA